VTERTKAGVVRVLNIVTPECRLLSSRERCPFLVHLEVAETGLEGNDAKLYALDDEDPETMVRGSLSMPVPPIPTGFPLHGGGDISNIQNAERIGASGRGGSQPEEHNYHTQESVYDNTQGGATYYHTERSSTYYHTEGSDTYYVSQSSQYDVYHHQQMQPVEYESQSPTATNELTQIEEVKYVGREDVSCCMIEQNGLTPLLLLIFSRPTTGTDLLDSVFGPPWNQKCEEIRQASPYGNVEGWRIASFIMKAGEDIRRECMVMQIISKLNEWFKLEIEERYRPVMRPYAIMCVGEDAGMIECLSDAKSLDQVKKRTDEFTTLYDFFVRAFGQPTSRESSVVGGRLDNSNTITFEKARDNFLRSLVGYSLVCYILQIKDRHNANILMDREGHIMHIDFGYVLGDTPKMGKVPIFREDAPFKLSREFWEVLRFGTPGGLESEFCQMLEAAFVCASDHADEIVSLVEAALMNIAAGPETARNLARGVRDRLRFRGAPGSEELRKFISGLVDTALTSRGTSVYDWLQRYLNGYD